MKTTEDKAKINKPLLKSSNAFPVVGIGASAGGLDAFKKLLKAISENSGIAYVLVQHLDPTHESLLPELLQKVTAIPVLEISDDIKVEPNHIYIIPSNKMLIANDGKLELSPRPAKSKSGVPHLGVERNLPIDLFFSSLAEVHQSHAIGVVLSGTASDGTNGLKAIKDHGGITFAQDEASAAYDGMPNSAVQAGVVDFILPPEEIPRKLLEITRTISSNGKENMLLEDDDVFKQILLLLRIRRGTDFTYYKQTTIRRRILRRMVLNKIEALTAYLKYLRENKGEQDILYQDLLIPVTSFFRDPKTFEHLCNSVFPHISKSKLAMDTIRVWVVGCSTGEEAYSIAICLKEYFESLTQTSSNGETIKNVQIFATDISEPAIAKARAGFYTKSEVEGVSPQRLKDFFTKSNDGYQIDKQVRNMCVFAGHNFLKDPPFGKMDFISCRNVLIYMEPYLQKKALTTFHYSLNPKGFLLLGKSETSSSVPDLFISVDKTDKLFNRKDVTGKYMLTTSQRGEQSLRDTDANPNGENRRTDFQKTADDIILSNYTPAGVVVNEAMDIVHFRGSTGAYLEQLPGKPSHNLLRMAKSGLGFELRNILHKAKKDKASVIKENIPVHMNGDQHIVSIEAIPLPNIVEPHYLVLFRDTIKATNPKTQSPKSKASSKTKKEDKDPRIEQLEKELAQTREDMRSITEDQEAANEELQSANEELLSSSEELQTMNEEMESSKEELQSTNEELTVLNQQMINLNEQVTIARDYAETIIATTHEPLVVLDATLRIKTANRSFYKAFEVNERQTEGILIYELGNNQWDIPALRKLLEKILPEKESFFDLEVTHDFRTIGQRTMLLNAREMKAETGSEKLILLGIEDITERKQATKRLKESEHRYHSMIYSSPSLMAIFKGEDMVISIANDAIIESWGKGKDIIGKSVFEAIPETVEQGFDKLLLSVYKTGTPVQAYESPIYLDRYGKRELLHYTFVYQAQRDLNGEIEGVAVIANEVTPQVEFNKRIKESEANFRQLAELMPDKVSNREADGSVVYFNQNWLDYTGLGFDELKGAGWQKIVHPDDREKSANLWDKSQATEKGVETELRLLNKKGEYKWHLSRTSTVKDDNGKITKWIIATTEIQQQKELREELEQAVINRTQELLVANEALEQKNYELGKMNKELESFTYISSHDLQEPLRKIQTFAALIVEKENQTLSEGGKDYFNRMQGAAKRMQKLIDDLLAFSRVSTAERKFENTDLRKTVEEVKKELSDTIHKKNAIIETEELGNAFVNPFQFSQLLQNLIGNSLKFSNPEKPPHIVLKSDIVNGNEVNSASLSSYKNYCHISLSDNGIGFDPQFSERIFQLFQRLHGKNEYPGTGIGLSIVKKIVENHNGIITATSELNKGATFDIYIPVS